MHVEGMTNDEVRSGARSSLGIPSSFLIRISPVGVIRNSPMKSLRYALFLFPAIALSAEQSASSFPQFDAAAAERFAKLALDCAADVPGSPIPPGASVLLTICTPIFGA